LFWRLFLIFSKKKSKTGAKTSFYFAASGGEILFTKPQPSVKVRLLNLEGLVIVE
jgi:hypothetical protein